MKPYGKIGGFLLHLAFLLPVYKIDTIVSLITHKTQTKREKPFPLN